MEKTFESNFISTIIGEDLETGKYNEVITRFPPEPNGCLHIGHLRGIALHFETAKMFRGKTNLRFDDTNPVKEDLKFVNAIKEDIEWLGYRWENLFWASNYFDELYKRAILLIKKGLAYVDDQTPEEIRETRGTLTEPGINSPYRNRLIEENLDLFERMKNKEFTEGSKVLRAKIDMASPNINLRDPIIYRITYSKHHNTGDKWCIYPMYDFAHPLSDAIEGISHSMCSLEFEDHRPLYDWFVRECEMEHVPTQIEYSKLYLSNTILSKRNLRKLVQDKLVDGWDDPRLATIRGLRRRGYTKDALKNFVFDIGISKSNGIVDYQQLEHYIREDLKLQAPRTMAVLKPLKVVITNYPEGEVEYLEEPINKEVENMGTRKIPFSREIYIEQEDFMEVPIPKYRRLYPGNEVRLAHAYFIKCTDVIKDENGNIKEIHATYDPETKSGTGFTGRKVKGTIHWVDANHNIPCEIRLYDHLTIENDESKGLPFIEKLNPNSLEVLNGFIESELKDVKPYDRFQFTRNGYFVVDPKDTLDNKIVFNRIVSLKSSFKIK
ncbi:glutamine--tRNA ligase/YqeY domain fusion protein [Mycoplasmatota bacterium]|nr:glutamine--tRNA ligase/YqeY domain fusion protein [Mycoplasmatota bacterium]